jgi:Zn-dependent peptidase ImmA (M78 family)
MSEKIPLTPGVLKWARETSGVKLDEVARKMGKKTDTIQSWESGLSTPTYIQLEKLAYQIYKRPIALFFFPEPPEEESPKQSFRTLPEREIEMMPPRMRYLLKQARAMQVNLAELNDFTNPAKQHILHDLTFQPNVSVKTMAAEVRAYLGIDLDTQFNWKSVDEALHAWRDLLQKYGIFVFKEVFKDESFSGFCLYDREFPLIYLNNGSAKSRQVFSIFHELAHLLMGTGGIDTRKDDYINQLKGDDRKIEILCNTFAGAFLVPDPDFSKRIKRMPIDDISIRDLAGKYKVSREVILRKCLDRGLVTEGYYSRKVAQWAEEAGKKSSSGGGNYYATKGAYLGEGYLSLAFSRYFQNKISVQQLADYLGVKVKGIPGMESLLFSKGGLA